MSANIERMDDRTFYSYAHPKRKRRFCLALVFATLLFPLIALGLIAGTIFLVVPLFALLLWMSMRTIFAHWIGNMVMVSEVNYPRINTIAEEMKQRLGYDKRVFVFVYESGQFNIYLSHLFFRRAIFLNSEILENGVSDDEIRWLVGRFVGYLRARRQAGVLGWLIRAAQYLIVFNVFLLPYERAMVLTGDRLAVAGINGDVSSAIAALQKTLVGRQLGYSLNPEGIIAQHRLIKGTFFGFLARVAKGFPHTTARYIDLIAFAKVFFPSQYGRFLAANPAMPDDLMQLAKLPDKPAGSDGRVQSGLTEGWVTCVATLAAVAIPVFLVVKHAPSMATAMSSYESPSSTDMSGYEATPGTEPPLGDSTPVPSDAYTADIQQSTTPTPDSAPPESAAPVQTSDETSAAASSSDLVSRESEAIDAGYAVDQEWSEVVVPKGQQAYIDVDGRPDASYLVLARGSEGCDVDAVINNDIKDDSPSPDASLTFGVGEPGTIRVDLPVNSVSDNCVVGVGVYKKDAVAGLASD